MAESSKQDTLSRILNSGTMLQAKRLISDLTPAEIADLVASLPRNQRAFIWNLVDPDEQGEALVHMGEEVRTRLIEEMEPEQLLAATENLDVDDLADLLQSLPEAVNQEILTAMDRQNRHRLEAVLSYGEDSAGGMMNLDVVTVRPDVPLEVVMRYLRLRGELPAMTDSLYVVNKFDQFLGILPIHQLLTKEPTLSVGDVMESDEDAINVSMSSSDVARIFEQRDLVSAPVVDEDGKLLGRITIDDVVDLIRDEGDHNVMSMAGLNEDDDIFAPVVSSAKRRAVWLGINLATAFLASWVIGQFEATLDKIVALAVLMPIVASMGGIAGSQTLTLVIRGIALGQLGKSNTTWLLNKELFVSLLNGALWALVVAGITALWFHDLKISAIIAAALIINMFAGAFAGVAIPLLLKRLGVDPALAGSVVLTTVTDVVGFLAFLGLATAIIL